MSERITHAPRQGVPPALMSAWQRWEMNMISTQPVSAASPVDAGSAAPAPPLVLDEAALAELRQQAQRSGEIEGRQQGYAQGLAQGQTDGYAAGLKLAQAQAQALRTLLASLPAALQAAEREVADDLLALALDIARQMVGQALVTEPEHILTLVRELLRTEPTLSGTPRLLMHVDDAALVQQHLADDLHAAGWRIRTDLTISRGGCRVHAASGALDATLETRWERVASAFVRSATPPPEEPHD